MWICATGDVAATTADEALRVNAIFRHRPNKMLHPYEQEMSDVMVLTTLRYTVHYGTGLSAFYPVSAFRTNTL